MNVYEAMIDALVDTFGWRPLGVLARVGRWIRGRR